MKKILFFVSSIIFMACSDDVQDIVNPMSENGISSIEVVRIDGNDIIPSKECDNVSDGDFALRFKTMADYELFKNKLSEKTRPERIELVNELGFSSLYKIAENADIELENIGSSAKSESDFADKYAEYVDKYKNILVKNDVYSNDLTLYVPSSGKDELEGYLVGKSHKVVIGDEIIDVEFDRNVNLDDRLLFCNEAVNEQTFSYLTRALAPEQEWPINSFIEINGHKKTIFNCTLSDTNVNFHFGAQKKMWYGWKRDNDRTFYFRLENVLGMNINERDIIVKEMPYDKSNYYLMLSGTSGDINFKIGTLIINPAPMAVRYKMFGNVYVWTDMTIDRDDSGNIIYGTAYINGTPVKTSFPQLSKDKSYPCKISYMKTVN